MYIFISLTAKHAGSSIEDIGNKESEEITKL